MSNDKQQNGQGQGKPGLSYKILIDHKPHDWPKPTITGAEIKQLAGVDVSTYEAWQDVAGPEDRPVGDDEGVDLTPNGNEKFFVVKKATTEG